jgi:hypothetical protein
VRSLEAAAPPCDSRWAAYCSSFTLASLAALALFLNPSNAEALAILVLASAGLAYSISLRGGLYWSPAAVAAAAVAATAVEWLLTGRNRVRGMVGLAEMVEPLAFLDELAGRGLEAEVFEGDRALA